MIDVKVFYDELSKNEVDFFCGVPDSLLKSFCAYVTENTPVEQNIIAANEGAAIALASGYHIGTGKIPLIYMQNSGIGNAVNPLMSLADPDVYSIPQILLIGWRGEPGIKDEPQHLKQGKVTLDLLNTMKIPFSILEADSKIDEQVSFAVEYCKKNSSPYALVVRKGIFSEFKLEKKENTNLHLTREAALELVLDSISSDSIVVSATGMLSRELFELRERKGELHSTDFLTVGSMGHTSQIALGIALTNPTKEIYCFDGDGGALMHLGSYAIIGNINIKNLKIIIFNNGAHDSVGGQPTVGLQIDFRQIFKGFGFEKIYVSRNSEELKNCLIEFIRQKENSLLEIKVKKGARKDLGRPTQTPQQTKLNLMHYIKGI